MELKDINCKNWLKLRGENYFQGGRLPTSTPLKSCLIKPYKAHCANMHLWPKHLSTCKSAHFLAASYYMYLRSVHIMTQEPASRHVVSCCVTSPFVAHDHNIIIDATQHVTPPNPSTTPPTLPYKLVCI